MTSWLIAALLLACGANEPASEASSEGSSAPEAERVGAAPSEERPHGDDEPAATTPAGGEPVTKEATAELVRARRQDSRAAVERGDLAADAAARLALVSAYVAWAEGHPSEEECMPPPPEDPPEQDPPERRLTRAVSNDRLAARDELRQMLDCAEERGAEAERLAALLADLERLGDRAAAVCERRGLRPMQGNVAALRALGSGSPCPADEPSHFAASSAIDRVLGIPSEAPSLFRDLGELPGVAGEERSPDQ